jgi:hypothetical protein
MRRNRSIGNRTMSWSNLWVRMNMAFATDNTTRATTATDAHTITFRACANAGDGKLRIKITSIKKIVPGSQEVRADQGDLGGAEDGRSREGSRRSPADLVGC